MTTICEFGMICVQSLCLEDKPTVSVSTKFGVRPRPKMLYGRLRLKCADWGSWDDVAWRAFPSCVVVLYDTLGPGKFVP